MFDFAVARALLIDYPELYRRGGHYIYPALYQRGVGGGGHYTVDWYQELLLESYS